MIYCQVSQNGQIGSPQALPTTFENVSNFHTLDADILPSYGFYPFISSGQPSYDAATQRVEQQLQLSGQSVIQAWTIVDLTPEEQQAQVVSRLTEIGNRIQPYLDSQVSVKQYDSIVSATSWNLSNITTYKAEAEQATAYRDQVWQEFGNLVASVQAGNATAPTADEWFASLTPLWPAPLPPSNGTLS